jgi:hypothetical protein
LNERNIAVFGDTHGHLRLMLQLCRLWQRAQGRHLDLVLQCGDLGYFPDPGRLDKATGRFAKNDPEELGFSRYFALPEPQERDELVERTLTGPSNSLDSLRCPLLWTHGNHEDFAALEHHVGKQCRASVDAYSLLEHLATGAVVAESGLRIAAVGGGPETQRPKAPRHNWQYVDERACERLLGETFDILITHCAPSGLGGETDHWGSPLLRTIDEFCQPAYHLFAHHKRPIPEGLIGKRTRCIWLDDVTFRRTYNGEFGHLSTGCMAIIHWRGPEDHDLEILDSPWLREVNWHNWRHL